MVGPDEEKGGEPSEEELQHLARRLCTIDQVVGENQQRKKFTGS